MQNIGLGGGCHWCTEAIFQSLKGIHEVKQGWIKSNPPWSSWSEAVLISFDSTIITLSDLIEVHLYTHGSTSNHKLTEKYRSSIYFFTKEQEEIATQAVKALQINFEKPLVTKVIPFIEFKINEDQFLNYYQTDEQRPFCENVIKPKLDTVSRLFKDKIKS